MLFEALCIGRGQIIQDFEVEFEVLRCHSKSNVK